MTEAPHDLQSYLAALRRALGGAPPGLIADALADAQEHLQGAREAAPERSEAEILAAYGSPEEVAAEYLRQEAPPASPFAQSSFDKSQTPPPKFVAPPPRRFRMGFFAVLADPLTYGALLYMLLTLVTGAFYSIWVMLGVSLSLGLAILVIGIPFFLLFMASVRLLSYLEGRIVEVLLGVRMPRRLPSPPAQATLNGRIMGVLADPRSWTSIAYMLLLLPLGTVYCMLAVCALAVPGALAFVGLWQAAMFWRPIEIGRIAANASGIRVPGFEFGDSEGVWYFHGPGWMVPWMHTPIPGLMFLAAAILVFVALLHVIRALGRGQARIAERLLVRI